LDEIREREEEEGSGGSEERGRWEEYWLES